MMKPKSGFTIVEMLIYMALLSIMLVVVTELFLAVLDVQSESEVTSVIQQDGRYVLSRFNYDLYQAKTITTPALGATSNNLIATIGLQTYSYQLSGPNLTLSINGAAADQLNSYSSSVSGLTFMRIGNGIGKEDTIKINFNLTSMVSRVNGPQTTNFQTTVGLRPN